MISIENVTKSYNNNKVIDNLSMEIRDGEIFGFLGPNGAGKTTTIKMMTGITNIDNGEIFIDDYNIKKNPLEAKKNFGFISDNPDVFLKFKGIEYLNFLADIYQVELSQRKEMIGNLAQVFNIKEILNDKIQSYSHGTRQKILIIGSLIHQPKNLIMDEPMTGLDPKSAFELKKIMKNMRDKKHTIFFSTHILDIAEKLCDRIGIINKGKLLFIGTLEDMKKELKENKSLEELFMEITKKDEENI